MHRSRYAADPLIAPLLLNYRVRLAGHVADIQTHVQAGNLVELQRILHQLKGSGKSYGYDEISTHAAAAEESLNQQSLDSAAAHISALTAYIQDIEGFTPIEP